MVPDRDGRGGGVRWAVSVDVVVLGDGGNLDDAVALAAYLALRDARVPKTTLVEDGDERAPPTFDVDPDVSHALAVDASRFCLAATAWVVAGKVLVDPTTEEEACADAAVTVRVGADGLVHGIYKREGGALDPATFAACVATAATVARQFMQAAEAELARAATASDPTRAEVIRAKPASSGVGNHDDEDEDEDAGEQAYGGGGAVRIGTRVMLSRR